MHLPGTRKPRGFKAERSMSYSRDQIVGELCASADQRDRAVLLDSGAVAAIVIKKNGVNPFNAHLRDEREDVRERSNNRRARHAGGE